MRNATRFWRETDGFVATEDVEDWPPDAARRPSHTCGPVRCWINHAGLRGPVACACSRAWA